jgi:hypothetical protein
MSILSHCGSAGAIRQIWEAQQSFRLRQRAFGDYII